MTPWTPRERALRAALEKVNNELCVTSPLAISRGVAQAFSIINAALADQPPPDPRDEALRQITEIGGNLPDERLTTATGPRDAAARGLMYVRARAISKSALSDPPPPDPRDEALRLAEAELLRLWKLVPAGRAGVGGVRTIELEDDEVARLRQIVDAIRAAKGVA